MSGLKAFYRELRRRKVLRACLWYLLAAWLVLQLAWVFLPMLGMDRQQGLQLLALLAMAGFPLVVILAWLFDLTPRGVERTQPFQERRLLSNIPPINDRRRAGGRPAGATGESEPASRFTWVLSAETGPLAGLSFGIDRSVVMGRSLESDIAVVSPQVSRQHARLDLQDGDLYIEDLNSSNGTVVNGRRLRSRTRLQHADEVRFHDIVFRVVYHPPPSAERGVAEMISDPTVVPAGERAEKS
ncbi:MAG: FHA domain-containing protein [Haliea sp.]|nr:FHA domain-containing protein [Haliea sp.]